MAKFKNLLKGERIVLKRTKPEIRLAEIMFKTVDSNREHLGKWLSWVESTKKIEDTLEYLITKEKETELGKKVEYGIFVDESYAGNIAVFDIDEKNKSAEVGYWLSQNFIGNGYMFEALGIVEKEFFENRDLNRMQLKCDVKNEASIKVAKKCGYEPEGEIREEKYSEYFGNFRNTLVFSKLKSEYFSE